MSASNSYRTPVSELGGGRIAILLLLFAMALYQFYSAGFGAFAVICALPIVAIALILTFRFRMLLFWALVVINYLVQMKSSPLPSAIPISMWNEMIEILLLLMIVIDVKDTQYEWTLNPMLAALILWCSFCTLELLNDTCDMGYQIGLWYSGARLMAFQLLFAFLVFTLYIDTPQKLITYIFLWGAILLFAVFWIWKQRNYGFTEAENSFIQGPGRRTHIINGGATIRYFSIFSDAASCGINLASSAVAFLIFAITSKIKRYRYAFLVIGCACCWGMLPSGTRTAIFCLLAGFFVYTVLSKSVKLTAVIGTLGVLIFVILAFTEIGNSNSMIRRMRTAFDTEDASASVRTMNKQAIKKYIVDAPFGIGIGIHTNDVSPNSKFYKLSTIPPDSEYVYIWVRTGIIGISIFVFTTIMMFLGACRVVMFQLTSSSLRGIGGGLCCAFVSVQLGGYANQILMQFPNCLVFYGGLSLVFILPRIEQSWLAHEARMLEKQTERERIKEEKKRAKRV